MNSIIYSVQMILFELTFFIGVIAMFLHKKIPCPFFIIPAAWLLLLALQIVFMIIFTKIEPDEDEDEI